MPTNGEIIRRARKSLGEKRDRFARSIGISAPTLDRLERDDSRVDPATVARAAAKLGLAYDAERGAVIAPAYLPPERRRPRPFRVLRVPSELLAGLEIVAKDNKRTVIEELQAHVDSFRFSVTQPTESDPVRRRETHGAGT